MSWPIFDVPGMYFAALIVIYIHTAAAAIYNNRKVYQILYLIYNVTITFKYMLELSFECSLFVHFHEYSDICFSTNKFLTFLFLTLTFSSMKESTAKTYVLPALFYKMSNDYIPCTAEIHSGRKWWQGSRLSWIQRKHSTQMLMDEKFFRECEFACECISVSAVSSDEAFMCFRPLLWPAILLLVHYYVY